MKIQRIFVYPIKSLGPVELAAAEITNEGLRFDRQYVLVKPPHEQSAGLAEHITIKTTFQLGLFKQSIDKSWSKLTVTHTQAEDKAVLVLPLSPSPLSLLNAETFQVSIFGTKAPGLDMGEEAARYFSHHLKQTVRLLYIGGNGQREIPGAAFIPKNYQAVSISVNDRLQPQRVRFADAAPLLITSTASEEDARRRLPPSARGEDLIVRFRPNIHVDVGDAQAPYDEDTWNMLSIRPKLDPAQEIMVRCLFKTVRCLSLNVDLSKGAMITTPNQLFGLLMKDRRTSQSSANTPAQDQAAPYFALATK
ncbi:uncharacterized protein LTR77_008513 [Saxophila tyrrhenica]|uniref:MOSC domain-containing protein n=1 Tax=Saxophila tyrrhenica TaxID=1690608 RepID=A0AAV9P155_9PEZI|nr:hypothetical protein LTR77_008513 [Saxophila tyrrhenica]